MHTPWDVLAEHCKLFVTFGGVPHKNARSTPAAPPSITSRAALYGMRAKRRALRQRDADRRRPRHRRRRRVAGDPAQHRHRADPGALPHAADARTCTTATSSTAAPWASTSSRPRSPARTPAWAEKITGIPAPRIAALAREMAATRTMVNINWSLQRSASRRAAVLGAGHAGLHAGPDRPAGRRLRRGLRPGQPDGQRASEVSAARPCRRAPTPVSDFIPVARFTDMLLQPGRHRRLQRPRPHLSRHPAGLLGGRQSVPSPPGPQPPDAGVAQARDHRRSTSSSGRRPRAWPTSCCRRPPAWSATTSATAAASPT